MAGCISTGYHLGVNVRLCAVDLADIFNAGWAGLAVDLICAVSAADRRFCNGNPWIVMAEDTCIFFISWRVGADLAKVQIILAVSRLEDHNTVFGVKTFFYRIESFFGKAFFYTDPCHNAESLWFNKDLTLLTFRGTDFFGICIVCTEKPFSVPACIQNCLVHILYFF